MKLRWIERNGDRVLQEESNTYYGMWQDVPTVKEEKKWCACMEYRKQQGKIFDNWNYCPMCGAKRP